MQNTCKRNFKNDYPTYWIGRLFLACQILFVSYATCFEPRTLVYTAIGALGKTEWWFVFLVGLLCVVAIADVIVNDFMPDGFSLRRTQKYRHIVYMTLCMVSICTAVLIAKTGNDLFLIVNPLLQAIMAACIAYMDLIARHRAGLYK